jgi:Bax protein
MQTDTKQRLRFRDKAVIAVAALGLGVIQTLPFVVPAGNTPSAAPFVGTAASVAEATTAGLDRQDQDREDVFRQARPRMVIVGGADEMLDAFVRVGYTLNAVEEATRYGDAAVPRFLLDTLPRDLQELDSIESRKALFIKAMLPLILAVNEGIVRERREIQAARQIIAEGGSLSLPQALGVQRIMNKYGSADLGELERRVDVIPPSLALAQAAEESGWGTSRFAKQANALFGHTGSLDGTAVIPSRDRTFALRSFERLVDAVQAYCDNLNTHAAYKDFRQLRSQLRAEGKTLDSQALAGTLIRYSERGKDYIKNIRAVIRTSRLTAFDAAKLNDDKAAGVIYVASI